MPMFFSQMCVVTRFFLLDPGSPDTSGFGSLTAVEPDEILSTNAAAGSEVRGVRVEMDHCLPQITLSPAVMNKKKCRCPRHRSRSQRGITALHWASYKGHVEVVKALLAANANPNIQAAVREEKNTSRRHSSA